MANRRERTFAALILLAFLATSCGGTQLDTASAPDTSAAPSSSVVLEADSAAAGEDFSFDSVSGETTVVWFWAPG